MINAGRVYVCPASLTLSVDTQAFIDNSDLIISNQDTAVFNKILANSTDTILYL